MYLQLNGKHIKLETYYINLFPKIRVYVVQNSGNDADAKDVFQEALLTALLNVNNGKFKGNESDLDGYIYQIAKYKWLDILKLKYKKVENLTSRFLELEDEIHTKEYAEDDTKYLIKAISDLGQICRKLLQLFYFKKLSLKEIGERLGYSGSVTKTKKYRCMTQLRKNYLSNYEN